jgi:hypothetical protein
VTINVNAAQIVELANDDGIAAVARELNCTARQATEVTTLARKAFAQGRDLPADAIPTGTVAAARAVHPARIGHAFTDAEVRAMAEKVAPAALVGLTAEEYHEHQRAEQERERRARNKANDPAYDKPGPMPIGFESHEERARRLRERVSR